MIYNLILYSFIDTELIFTLIQRNDNFYLDCNEDVYSKKQMYQFLQNNGLYNAIPAKHCGEGPATYDRGSKCIDLIAVSNSINRDAIVRCGYLPFYDGVF